MESEALKIESESEMQASSLIMNDRGLHGVFRLIRELSTPKNAEKAALFDAEHTRVEIPHFDQRTLPKVLQRLEKERMVLSFPCLQFDSEEKILLHRQVFVTRPTHESASLEAIVDNIFRISAGALQDRVRSGINPDLIVDDLLQNWDKLPDDFKVILDLSRELTRCETIFPFEESRLQLAHSEISSRLASSNLFKKLTENLFVPAIPGRIQFLFEVCETFMDEKLTPYLAALKPGCCKEYRVADMENRLARGDERKRPTALLSEKKADALLREFQELETIRGAGSFLSAKIVKALGNLADNAYEEEWKKVCRDDAMSFTRTLNSHGGVWTQAIRFISAREVLEFVPDVWRIIQEDSGIYRITWEQSSSRYHIIMTGDPDALWIIFRGLLDLSGSESWKITAVKTLVERYELSLQSMFKNPLFVKLYGKVLKKAYLQYMPFYLRFFMTFKMPFLHKPLFRMAREKIEKEQRIFGRHNQAKLQAFYRKQSELNSKEAVKMMEQSYKNTLMASLDRLYLEEQKIPIVTEVLSATPEIDLTRFWKIARNSGFRTIPVEGVKTPENRILLQPADSDWRIREVQIRKLIDRLKVRADLLGSDGDPIQADRARKLEAYLKKNSSFVQRMEEDTDPYERLQIEIDRENKNEF